MPKLFRRVLVPYDFSPPAARALKVAAGLAAENRGRLDVLHVVIPVPPMAGFPVAESGAFIPPADIVEGSRQSLERAVARTIGTKGPRATCRVVIGDPLQRIIAAARSADVIVMATTGRTGFSHLLIGSVAEKVVRHAPVPVLTVRTGARSARRRRS
jgi:nucleotide-binding universal stress UspA family protein